MSRKKHNSYTAEFKESAVKLAVESDQSVSQTAKELGINANTLYTWVEKHHHSKAPKAVVKAGELPRLCRLGALAGGELTELARQADKNPPQLQVRTRTGLDEQRIIKHPAYHQLERYAFSEFAMAALFHRDDLLDWPGPLPPVLKYLFTYLFAQAEFGLLCPVSMTDSLTRTLKNMVPRHWCRSICRN
ncbi:MAG: transposase [Enterobacteriaceae bacterium]